MLARTAASTIAIGRRAIRSVGRFMKRRARSLLDRRVYRVRRGLARGLRRRGGFGFIPQLRSTPEQRFLRSLELEGKVVYDIGAFEGLHTLFFARRVGRAGRVFAFEPNPRTSHRALENLELNHVKNVELLPIAIGDRSDLVPLLFDPQDAGRGSIVEGGPTRRRTKASVPVEVRPVDELVAAGRVPPPDFVKIDVEGAEGAVLAGMEDTLRRHRPPLFIEVHGHSEAEKLANVQSILERQRAVGYRCRHVETDQELPPRDGDVPIRGHLYCTPIQPR
jgi:FkbM family methyltransferase